MSDFRFDPVSFLIGFISGTVIAYIVYRLRRQLSRLRAEAGERAESARRFATRTADARYQIDIYNYCQQYHTAGKLAPLTDILVEPRFIQGIQPYDTTGERRLRDVFRVVPMIHEFPACYAPYNIPTFSIKDLGAGERHLALLGQPGSGRSTALAAIALWALGRLDFAETEDIVQQSIEEEEAQLSDEELEARLKKRAEIQKRAMELIKHAQEQASEALAEGEEQAERPILDLHRLMPILVHIDDVVVDQETANKKIDPAEPLVRAIQHNVRRITAVTVPRYVYNRLNSGQALVLIDGLDDLPLEERPYKLAWLQRFLDTYPECMVIVSGPAAGYHPLTQLGLTPIFLRPWTDHDVLTYAQKWAAVWPQAAGSRRQVVEPPDERTLRMVTTDARGLTPLDLTMRIFATYSNLESEPEERPLSWDWYNAYITNRFQMKGLEGKDDLADEALYTVARLAAAIQTEGALSTEQLTALAENALQSSNGANLNINELLRTLTIKSGLMVERTGQRYDFAHPLLRAFLASVTVIDPEGDLTLDQVVSDPHWADAIPFAAAHAPETMMNRAVRNRLSQQPDLLLNNLFSLVHWVPDAPINAPWRGEVFKRLTAALLTPSQFPTVRERAMAALVTTRDKNVLFILRQALRATNTHVRLLGCIGLGALGKSDAIKELRPMLEDDDLDVQLAAALALGAIGTETALEVMVEGLLTGEESLRQAVAEALAAIPGQGHQILHTAITSEDMMVRRAAVFGLARLNTSWALTDLYHALLEDDQWYVRSAAEQAFAKAQRGVSETAQAHPPLEQLDWIVSWAQEQGKQVLTEEEMPSVLLQMLEQGEQPYRIASARTLGYVGYVPAIQPLYHQLRSDSPPVRAAAYAALSDLQSRLGEPLPGVL